MTGMERIRAKGMAELASLLIELMECNVNFYEELIVGLSHAADSQLIECLAHNPDFLEAFLAAAAEQIDSDRKALVHARFGLHWNAPSC